MASIKPTNPIDINKALEDLELYKYHPNALVEHSLNFLADMNDGRVDIIDPNTPIAYTLETAALMAHYAIQEHTLLTRKMYPVLANTEDDLYRHMSDKDYLGRFSKPAYANVTLNVLFNDFKTKAYTDPVTRDKVLVIPRNYRISIEDTIYSLPASIKIRMTESGVIDVRFDTSVIDDIFPLSTDYIPFDIINFYQNETYISFTVRIPEVDLEVATIPVTKSKLFKDRINYKEGRQFYYIKAYHLDVDGKTWLPMITTHSEDVWDIKEPTCIVRVHSLTNELEYYIPPAYINNGTLGAKVRLVVYTTKGAINIDYEDYLVSDFKLSYNEVFPEVENTVETYPLKTTSIVGYIREKVIDGRNQKSFDDLKKDVINNNLRVNLPITLNQMEHFIRSSDNFANLQLIRSHDVVTSREFLFKTSIPSNVSRYKISKMSLDMIEFKTSTEDLLDKKNSIIEVKKDILIIPHGTLFEVDRSRGVRILPSSEAKTLKDLSGHPLAKAINATNYMASYYHYILDSSGEFTDLRAYDVQKPTIESINFKDYNESTMIGVNSRVGEVRKVDIGYRIDILVDVKIFNELYDVNNVTPIIVYINPNGNRFYLEGKLYNDTAMGKVFSFYIHTDCYIDGNNNIHVTNFKDSNGQVLGINFPIKTELDILFCSNSVPITFNSKEMDDIINRSYLTGRFSAITRETYTIIFAEHMEHLYSRVHSSTGVDLYEYHTKDVYLKHDKTVFNEKNEIIHRPGDFVLDEKGNKVVQWKKGEVKLDENGKPIVKGTESMARYLNLLLIDYKFLLSTYYLTEQYKEHVRLHLRSLLLNNMADIQEELLEVTTAKLTVPNGQTDIMVQYDGKYGYIQPNQSFRFDVFVNERVYKDGVTREGIESTIMETLDSYLTGRKELSKTILVEEIRGRVKEFVKSVSLVNFTELKAEYIKIMDENAEISIKKKLTVIADGYAVEDDVVFNFVNTDIGTN